MKQNSHSLKQLYDFLKQTLKVYVSEEAVFTDIQLQPLSESGELVVFDDNARELGRTTISGWEGLSDENSTAISQQLRTALEQLRTDKFLNQLNLMKPYSFVLIDEEQDSVTELLIVDDEETLLLGDGLLKGLDEELDAFFAHLME